ncbi:epidermal growth factor-like protein 7 isoform X3 [Lemur catta]|uniref:epidermal growth factor-like protein 7 isoform X3 n=1 Tax=Lemur catta TaxID=9447 RepID=UPI001E268E0B|nr:epidermal growth factor-like protein 7 isoform X3 [Lemur catta]
MGNRGQGGEDLLRWTSPGWPPVSQRSGCEDVTSSPPALVCVPHRGPSQRASRQRACPRAEGRPAVSPLHPGAALRSLASPAASSYSGMMPDSLHLPVAPADTWRLCDVDVRSCPQPSIGPPTATAQGWPPPGLATPAAPAGRGPLGPPGSAEQQYASRHARTEGAVSSQAAAAALQDGRVTPASQMWTNAALEGAAVPSAVSTLRAVTGARAGRGTAHLQTVHSACPGEGPPGWPQAP